MSAISRTGLETPTMSVEQFRGEKLYQVTMSLVAAMRKQGLISADEYGVIDTIFTEKYHPIFGAIFSGSDLL